MRLVCATTRTPGQPKARIPSHLSAAVLLTKTSRVREWHLIASKS